MNKRCSRCGAEVYELEGNANLSVEGFTNYGCSYCGKVSNLFDLVDDLYREYDLPFDEDLKEVVLSLHAGTLWGLERAMEMLGEVIDERKS